MAWHVAALQRAKRLPSLTKLLGPVRPAKRQTASDIMRVFRQHNAVLGGEMTKH